MFGLGRVGALGNPTKSKSANELLAEVERKQGVDSASRAAAAKAKAAKDKATKNKAAKESAAKAKKAQEDALMAEVYKNQGGK